jgi:hypothetical protein
MFFPNAAELRLRPVLLVMSKATAAVRIYAPHHRNAHTDTEAQRQPHVQRRPWRRPEGAPSPACTFSVTCGRPSSFSKHTRETGWRWWEIGPAHHGSGCG